MFGKGFGVEPVPHLFEVSSEQICKNALFAEHTTKVVGSMYVRGVGDVITLYM